MDANTGAHVLKTALLSNALNKTMGLLQAQAPPKTNTNFLNPPQVKKNPNARDYSRVLKRDDNSMSAEVKKPENQKPPEPSATSATVVPSGTVMHSATASSKNEVVLNLPQSTIASSPTTTSATLTIPQSTVASNMTTTSPTLNSPNSTTRWGLIAVTSTASIPSSTIVHGSKAGSTSATMVVPQSTVVSSSMTISAPMTIPHSTIELSSKTGSATLSVPESAISYLANGLAMFNGPESTITSSSMPGSTTLSASNSTITLYSTAGPATLTNPQTTPAVSSTNGSAIKNIPQSTATQSTSDGIMSTGIPQSTTSLSSANEPAVNNALKMINAPYTLNGVSKNIRIPIVVSRSPNGTISKQVLQPTTAPSVCVPIRLGLNNISQPLTRPNVPVPIRPALNNTSQSLTLPSLPVPIRPAFNNNSQPLTLPNVPVPIRPAFNYTNRPYSVPTIPVTTELKNTLQHPIMSTIPIGTVLKTTSQPTTFPAISVLKSTAQPTTAPTSVPAVSVLKSTAQPITAPNVPVGTVLKNIPQATNALFPLTETMLKNVIRPTVIEHTSSGMTPRNSPQPKMLTFGLPVDITIVPTTTSPKPNMNVVVSNKEKIPLPVSIPPTQLNAAINGQEKLKQKHLMGVLSAIASQWLPMQSSKPKRPKTLVFIPTTPLVNQELLPQPPEKVNDSVVNNEVITSSGVNLMGTPEYFVETCSNEEKSSKQWDLNSNVVGEVEVAEALPQEEIKLVNESDEDDYIIDITVPQMFENVSDHAFYTKTKYDKPKPKPVAKEAKKKTKKKAPRLERPRLIGIPQPTAEHQYATSAEPAVKIRQNNLLICEKCGEKFDNPRQKKRHVRTRRHYLGWYCFLCDKKFQKLLNFWAHNCKHKSKNSYTFTNMHDYHCKNGKIIKREYYSKDKKIWQCNICYQLYFSQKVLHKHLVNCTIKCEICRANFTNAEEYRLHVMKCRLQFKGRFGRADDEVTGEVDSCLIHCKYCGRSFTKREVYIFQQHVDVCLMAMAARMGYAEKDDSPTKRRYKKLRDGDVDKIFKKPRLPKLQSPMSLGFCELTSPEIPTIGGMSENAHAQIAMMKSPQSMSIDDERIVSPNFQPLCVIEKLRNDDDKMTSCRKNLMAALEDPAKCEIGVGENEKNRIEIENAVLGIGNEWMNIPTDEDLGEVTPCSSPPFNFVITDVRGAIDFFSDEDNFDFSESVAAATEPPSIKQNLSPRFMELKLDLDVEEPADNNPTVTSENENQNGDDVDDEESTSERRLRPRFQICPRCAHKFPYQIFEDHPCEWLYSHLTCCRVKLEDVFKVRRGRSLKITNLKEIFNRHLRDKSIKSTEDENLEIKEPPETSKQYGRKAADKAKRRIRESSKMAAIANEDDNDDGECSKSSFLKRKNDVFDDGLGAKKTKLTVDDCEGVKDVAAIVESMSDCHLVVRQSRRINHPDWKYKCLTCDKKFFIFKLYSAHLRTHTEQFPFVCKDCGTGFRRKYGYATHKKIAKNSGKVKCNDCGQKFCAHSQLSAHADLHNLQKILKSNEIN